ncbi:MAG: UDP-N-acetylglucosamine acyltransferase [Terracoccus sp.]
MNSIHPSALVSEQVTMGSGNTIGPGVVLLGPMTIGDDNWFGVNGVFGAPAEIRGADHGEAWHGVAVGAGVVIGSHNVFREFVTIHQGHHDPTVVGDDCFLMNKVYVAHDGRVESGVTMASSVTLGGRVHVGRGANLGMNSVVHQRRVIGPGVMLGMGSVVTRDLPPYAKAFGNPSRIRGANSVGMEREGISLAAIECLASSYRQGAMPRDDVPAELEQAWAWWLKEVGQ